MSQKILNTEETGHIQRTVGALDDGVWGPNTQKSFDDFYGIVKPSPSGGSSKPKGTSVLEMTAFYGEPCDESRHVTIDVVYPMVLSWETTSKVSRITCHQLVAEPLKELFTKWLEHYGDVGIHDNHLDLYGGCFNCRQTRGGSSWSTHAWAAAIDIDPSGNGLRTPWPTEARMPREAIEIAELIGWHSAGKEWGRDAMHFSWTHPNAR